MFWGRFIALLGAGVTILLYTLGVLLYFDPARLARSFLGFVACVIPLALLLPKLWYGDHHAYASLSLLSALYVFLAGVVFLLGPKLIGAVLMLAAVAQLLGALLFFMSRRYGN